MTGASARDEKTRAFRKRARSLIKVIRLIMFLFHMIIKINYLPKHSRQLDESVRNLIRHKHVFRFRLALSVAYARIIPTGRASAQYLINLRYRTNVRQGGK